MGTMSTGRRAGQVEKGQDVMTRPPTTQPLSKNVNWNTEQTDTQIDTAEYCASFKRTLFGEPFCRERCECVENKIL